MAEKCGSFAQLPDALHAESFVSGVIGQFQHRMPDTAVLSDVLLDFVDALERTGGPEQYALLRALAAIGPARIAAAARAAADRRPYIADVEENGHDGDVLQAVLERRSFAVPYPGERLVEPGTPPELVVRLNAQRPDVPKDREAIVLCELLARGLDPAEYPYHVHVVEQLWADQPREVWESAQRLRARGLSRERVLELLAGALGPHVRELPVGRGGVGFDLKEYLDSLAAL
ncbi:hypothetical protein ACFQ0G_11590 [Streptomyces chiangmaiensis]